MSLTEASANLVEIHTYELEGALYTCGGIQNNRFADKKTSFDNAVRTAIQSSTNTALGPVPLQRICLPAVRAQRMG